MVTTPRGVVNVQRLLVEVELDLPAKQLGRGRGEPAAKVQHEVVRASLAPPRHTVSAKAPATDLPVSYTAEPAPTSAVAVLVLPTAVAATRTFATRANPADFDPGMSLAEAAAYVLAKTDAAGVPHDVAAARLQYEMDVARSANSTVNPDRSVNIATDADIVANMGGWAQAIIGGYQEQMNPAPRQSFDGTAIVIKDTYINPEDRIDSPRNAPYPGPYDSRMSLDQAIQHVFQYYDSGLLQLPNGTGHIPRSYTAQWLDNFIKQQKSAGVTDAGIVANLGACMQMVSSGYTFEAWRNYYAANPDALLEHNRMLAQNSAQTQTLAAQLA